MKKMLSVISGITLISSLPFSTSACSMEVRVNEYKSDPGFESHAYIFDGRDILINFNYPDRTFHHLEIRKNTAYEAV